MFAGLWLKKLCKIMQNIEKLWKQAQYSKQAGTKLRAFLIAPSRRSKNFKDFQSEISLCIKSNWANFIVPC